MGNEYSSRAALSIASRHSSDELTIEAELRRSSDEKRAFYARFRDAWIAALASSLRDHVEAVGADQWGDAASVRETLVGHAARIGSLVERGYPDVYEPSQVQDGLKKLLHSLADVVGAKRKLRANRDESVREPLQGALVSAMLAAKGHATTVAHDLTRAQPNRWRRLTTTEFEARLCQHPTLVADYADARFSEPPADRSLSRSRYEKLLASAGLIADAVFCALAAPPP